MRRLVLAMIILLCVGLVFAVDSSDLGASLAPTQGDGSIDNPLRPTGFSFGFTSECLLVYWDGDAWVAGSVQGLRGSGTNEDPAYWEDENEGATCIDGVVSKVDFYTEDPTFDQPVAVPAQRTFTQSVDFSKQEQEIDQVWQLIRTRLNVEGRIGQTAATKIWHPHRGWQNYREIYAPVAPTAAPGVLGGAIADPQIQKEFNTGWYDMAFLIKVETIAKELNVNPVHLMAVMRAESSFKPQAVHSKSKAAGLIQFTSIALEEMNKKRTDPLTRAKILAMNQLQQLDLVKEYFGTCRNLRYNNLDDVGLCVFWPGAIGKASDHVMFSRGSTSYEQNRVSDTNGDGRVTVGEFVQDRLAKNVYDLSLTSLFKSPIVSTDGLCFPLTQESYTGSNKDDFGSKREGGKRCHAGVDLVEKDPGQVIAVAPGRVVGIQDFLNCKDGWRAKKEGPGMTKAVFVYHKDIDRTINYGEIDADKVNVQIGQEIQQGHLIGQVGFCDTFHFELYQGEVSSNQGLRWHLQMGS